MIVDGFRSSLKFYAELIEDGEVDALLLISMDRKLCDVANHIAVCHRIYTERRFEAKTIFSIMSLRRTSLIQDSDRADKMLEETLEIQDKLLALRASVLVRLFERSNHRHRNEPIARELAEGNEQHGLPRVQA
ncbi:MAG TPA: hypothetical protein VFW59_05655 [Gallionella sp.]|nr:hypothetical protein [Gallionella sp.]